MSGAVPFLPPYMPSWHNQEQPYVLSLPFANSNSVCVMYVDCCVLCTNMYGKHLCLVTNQQMYISKIYFILPYIIIYRHVSVAPAAIVEMPSKNTNNSYNETN
jgi:hypothetical protein